PHHRHHHAVDPRGVLAREGRCRQHVVGGIDVHVILLGAMLEAWDARHDRVVWPGHVDLVVDDAAGMGHPLSPPQELVLDRIAERIAHAAVVAAHADALLHGGAEIERLRLLDLGHGADRHDQRQVMDGRIGERRCLGLDPDAQAFGLQPAADYRGTEVRIMTRPAAPYDHRLAHAATPYV